MIGAIVLDMAGAASSINDVREQRFAGRVSGNAGPGGDPR
jgi:hypothetical protein